MEITSITTHSHKKRRKGKRRGSLNPISKMIESGVEKSVISFVASRSASTMKKIAAATSTASSKAAQEKYTKLVPCLPSRLTDYVQSQAKELKDDEDKRYKTALKKGHFFNNSGSNKLGLRKIVEKMNREYNLTQRKMVKSTLASYIQQPRLANLQTREDRRAKF